MCGWCDIVKPDFWLMFTQIRSMFGVHSVLLFSDITDLFAYISVPFQLCVNTTIGLHCIRLGLNWWRGNWGAIDRHMVSGSIVCGPRQGQYHLGYFFLWSHSFQSDHRCFWANWRLLVSKSNAICALWLLWVVPFFVCNSCEVCGLARWLLCSINGRSPSVF